MTEQGKIDRLLSDLLMEIFEDDGQRERLYGTEKTATDAIQKVADLKRRQCRHMRFFE